jgi:hypothetical protein
MMDYSGYCSKCAAKTKTIHVPETGWFLCNDCWQAYEAKLDQVRDEFMPRYVTLEEVENMSEAEMADKMKRTENRLIKEEFYGKEITLTGPVKYVGEEPWEPDPIELAKHILFKPSDPL